MTGLTQGAVTSIDTRGVLGYSEGTWANDLRSAPPTTLPDAFTIDQAVLIWYCHDTSWRMGRVVRSRNPAHHEKLDEKRYEVEFSAGGPRIRDWYLPSLGYIRPDTPQVRAFLKAHGCKLRPNYDQA